tara:strand:+ start:4605 stop:4844 length:240 start_codon:yes stop_codon:yes gene_type:complete
MKITNDREVYWASTRELDIELNDTNYTVRIVENSKEASIIYFNTKTRSWDDLYEVEDNGDQNLKNLNEIYKSYEEGELI